jgi:hypothetical protein
VTLTTTRPIRVVQHIEVQQLQLLFRKGNDGFLSQDLLLFSESEVALLKGFTN